MTKPLQLALNGSFTIDAAEGEEGPKRTITGVALEYGVEVTDMWGTKARFEAGSLPLDGPSPKLIFENHHSVGGKAIGLVTERVESDGKVLFAARISKTQMGDEALQLASDGVLDQVSVTATPTQYRYDGDVLVVESAEWSELALVPFGAFGDKAKVTQVAAAAPTTNPLTREDTPTMSTDDNKIEAGAPAEPAIVPTNPLQLASFAAPKIDAATYLSYVASGKSHPAIEAAQQGLEDIPGLLPEPLVRDVFDTLNNRRPFVSAIGTFGMPAAGEIFNRRKITQHVDVDVQSAEFDDLATQKMTIEKIPVSKRTVGGFIELSEQSIDWSDPAEVALVLRDLSNVYAKRTETLATAALVADVTEEEDVDLEDGDALLDALYDASATINGVMDELPTHLFLSRNRWTTLGKAKASNGDRIFPAVGPMNAAGSMNPGSFTVAGLGLTVVVSNLFADDTMILGHPLGIELYEQNKGSIRVEKPSTMSVELAFRGYFASLVIEPGAFVKLVQDNS
jgi:phage head maturation protease